MELTHEDGLLALTGAPTRAVVEVRCQNTLNGSTRIINTETDTTGSAKFDAPPNFGDHTAISIRIGNQIYDLQREEGGKRVTPVQAAVVQILNAIAPPSEEDEEEF